jgi:murein DD-endopeptidase MepM/ murein hydrolase activator NlpD
MKFILHLLFFTLFAWGFDAQNGKSLILLLNDSHGIVALNDRNITVIPQPLNPNIGFAVLPFDYYAIPQIVEAKWRVSDKSLPLNINIVSAAYPTEILSVESAKVTPPPETLERIANEKAEAEKIYATYNPTRYWNKPFIRPIESITTSEYGSSRTYNGVLKSYHGGVDFRAKTPLPIIASNDGVVVLAKDRYYSGGTVIIDHGEGIYTCYFHFSQLNVKAGDTITQGQTLGLSGATGRITGPHLHFGIMAHGIQIDPLDFLAQINRLFELQTTIAQSFQK